MRAKSIVQKTYLPVVFYANQYKVGSSSVVVPQKVFDHIKNLLRIHHKIDCDKLLVWVNVHTLDKKRVLFIVRPLDDIESVYPIYLPSLVIKHYMGEN